MDVHCFPLEDHHIAFRAGSDRLHVLDGLARRVLDLAGTGLDDASIGTRLAQQLALDDSVATRLAAGLCDELVVAGLLGDPSTVRRRERPVRRPARLGFGQPPRASQACRIGSLRFRVDYANERLAALVGRYLAHLIDPQPAAPALRFLLAEDNELRVLSCDGRELIATRSDHDLILATIFHSAEAARRDEAHLAALHAGAVARDGRCLALSGASGAGKSTLLAHLVHRGYGYVADDMLLVRRADGHADPVPACISLKPGSWPVIAELRGDLHSAAVFVTPEKRLRYLVPDPAQTRIEQDPLPVAGIVFCAYQAGAAPAAEPLTAVEAFGRLIQVQSYLPLPLEAWRVGELVTWIAGRPAWQLRYDRLSDAEALVAELLR